MEKFNVKNYTTKVPAERSIAQIEKLLASFGATAIMKEFQADGIVYSLAFKINEKAYKLPANVKGVKKVMFEGKREYYGSEVEREKKAYRIAWRILKDWTHIQLSLILSGQSEPEEVLLPYLFDGEKTLYQVYKEGRLKLPQKGV